MGLATKQNPWLLSIFLVVTNSSYAQVFTYKNQAEHFEAEVTQGRLLVRERYRGASTINGDLSCPLGSAVKANVLPVGGGRKLCFAFSQPTCAYTRFQNGKAIHEEELARADSPRMCIELANAEDVQRLVTLVNVGPQQTQQIPTAPPAPAVKPNAAAATPAPTQASSSTTTVPQRAQQAPVTPPAAAKSAKAAPASPAPSQGTRPTTNAVAANSQSSPALPARNEQRSSKLQEERAIERMRQSTQPTSRNATLSESSNPEPAAGSGRWLTSQFRIGLGGNRGLTEKTYATASIVDDSGAARSPGRNLFIRNESDKYPLYYGLNNATKDKLEPGQEVTLSLEGSRASTRTGILEQQIALRWFDEKATRKK
jgi:hypothetical protein